MGSEKIKLFFNFLWLILFLSIIGATTLGTFKQGNCINLIQTCSNCSYNNISNVLYPNSTIAVENIEMTKQDTFYNYSFCFTSTTGVYIVNGYGDIDGVKTSWVYDFSITPNGSDLNTGESILYALFSVILFGIILSLSFFIFTMPKENLRNQKGEEIEILKIKYVRIFFITLLYPLIILLLNFLNGLAVNFVSLTMFSGILGFLFEIMLRLAWVFTVIIFLWIFISLIHDTNISKELKKLSRSKWIN